MPVHVVSAVSGAGWLRCAVRLAGENPGPHRPVRGGQVHPREHVDRRRHPGRRGDASGWQGRHVTAARDLVPLPSGGVLIDTPGLRGVGLLDLEGDSSSTFPEIEALSAGCRSATARMWPSRDVPSWPPSTREHCRPAAWRAGTSCGARRTTWRFAPMPGCALPSFAGGRPSGVPSGVRASADHEKPCEENRQEEYGPQQRTSPARECAWRSMWSSWTVPTRGVGSPRWCAHIRYPTRWCSHCHEVACPSGSVARALHADFDVFVARKVGAPGRSELGVGAIAEAREPLPADVPAEPTVWLDHELLRRLGLVRRRRRDRRRREGGTAAADRVYRGARPAGTRHRADRRPCRRRDRDRRHRPRVVARVADVGSRDDRARRAGGSHGRPAVVGEECDEVLAVAAPRNFRAVGAWYRVFDQLSDETVVALLNEAILER